MNAPEELPVTDQIQLFIAKTVDQTVLPSRICAVAALKGLGWRIYTRSSGWGELYLSAAHSENKDMGVCISRRLEGERRSEKG